MNIFVLIKQVPDTEARIRVSGGSIVQDGIKWIISPYDEIALEEAIRIKQKSGATVTVVSVGPADATSAIRTAYAMGADKGIHVVHPEYTMLDSQSIARALEAVVRAEDVQLILAGRQGSDSDNGQVPLMLATRLGIGLIPFAVEVTVSDGSVRVLSEAEGGRAVYQAALPAVITANAGLNEPRYPNLKGIMDAKKKAIDTRNLLELVPGWESMVEIVAYGDADARPKGKIIEGETAADKARALVQALHEDAKVI